MNAALQCLSNVEPLHAYFASGCWEEDINEENLLGMGGEIARAYAQLIQQMWMTTPSAVSPKFLKAMIDAHCVSFKGSEQHDAQELLAFLLDGLHEDLNLVTVKPYIEEDIDALPGKPHATAAAEAWRNHLLRNKSIIVDLFQGQTRSTLVCAACKYTSVKLRRCRTRFFYFLGGPVWAKRQAHAPFFIGLVEANIKFKQKKQKQKKRIFRRERGSKAPTSRSSGARAHQELTPYTSTAMPQLPRFIPTGSESPPAIMEALRNKIRQLETAAAMQQQMEQIQRRFDQQENERKMDQMGLKMELDKREAQAIAIAEVDKREAQARCDKLKANAKAEMAKREAQTRFDKLEASAKSEKDKRKTQARCDKLEALLEKGKVQARCEKLEATAKAEMDKLGAQAKAEMDKRDTQVKYEKLEAALENEKKDRLLQQQITQLKWEARPVARPGQTPQLMYSQPPPPQLVYGQPLPQPAGLILQQPASVANPAVLSPTQILPMSPQRSILPIPKSLQQPIGGVESGVQRLEEVEERENFSSSQPAVTALPTSPAKQVVLPSSTKQQKPLPLPIQEQPLLQQPSLHSHSPIALASARPAQQQQTHHGVVNVNAGAVALPGNAQSHFFLSHAQSTGGDQTNAIYLELRQMGFTCW
jgi:hypothetical protein